MKAMIIALMSLAVVVPVSAQNASPVLPCVAPTGAVPVAPEELPPALEHALHEKLGSIALPGGQFTAGDVGPTGQNHRYIFVWRVATRWIVAIEQGGIAYSNPIFVYELSKDGKTASLLKTRVAIPQTVCSIATQLAQN
jgi:hypothetical protein